MVNIYFKSPLFTFRCPSGTDGKRCETAPERCIGNPCMHNGRCQDFGSGLNCTCPDDYTGIGCQYEYDACQAGACKNGATCIDNGVGFTCVCPHGYTGKTCEDDIIDCKENSCPPSATCIDLTGKFFCQCPFNLTGDDCRKCESKFLDIYKKLRCRICVCITFHNITFHFSYSSGLRPLL